MNRKQVGNYIFIFGLVLTLILNLNVYELYLKMESLNYLLIAATLGGVFVCYTDYKSLLTDKKLWMVMLIDLIALINLILTGTGLITFFNIFTVSMLLYLADKVVFTRRQIMIISAFIAFFFIYWTIDVKGYFKGYSINFGGLVLLAGFVFLILIAEWVKYYLINNKAWCKYPFYITFFEMALFAVAYRIIAWYRSRTAFFALIAFGVILLIPKKLMTKRVTRFILLGGSVVFMTVFPVLYCLAGKAGLFEFGSIFYKPLIGTRTEVYSYLLNMVKAHPVLGNGTIYIDGIEPFRNGLLDACNGFLQIAVSHGLIVYVLILILVGWVILGWKQAKPNPVSSTVFAGIIAFMVASCSESMIVIAPFTVIMGAIIFVYRSTLEESAFEYAGDDTYKIYLDYIKADKGERILPAFCVTLMLLFMYLILGPLEVFYSNYIEFGFNAYDFGWYFLGVTLLAVVIVPMVLGSLPKIVSTVYCAIVLTAGIISYVQYMFINGDLVDENGNFALPTELGARYYASWIVTIVVIAAVVTGLILLKKYVNKIFVYASLFLTVIMAVAVASIGINLLLMENKPHQRYRLDAVHELDYGSEDNVIVLVLDTFGREALDEMLAEYSDGLDVFKDFTYYEKEDSVYSPTFPSLIHMLTEYEYTDQGVEEYQMEAFESDTSKEFFGELHDRGYNVSVYSNDLLPEDYMLPYIDNMTLSRVTVNKKDVRNKLFRMSVYRYVPYMMKTAFEIYNPKDNTVDYDVDGEAITNGGFLERVKDRGISVSDECPRKFSFNHLYGAHIPYINDEFGNTVPDDSASKAAMCKGITYILNDYFERLKEAGVYDGATIIVTADHGEHGNHDAIFFKKEAYETHDSVAVSDEMITHHDLQRLILEATEK